MLTTLRNTIVPAGLAGLFTCLGCASTDTASSAGAVEATAPASAPTQDTGAAGANPVESAKQARWRAAIRGLDFETGRVVVTRAASPSRAESRRAFDAGMIDFGRNDFVGAIGNFRDALINDVEHVEAYVALGDSLHMKGEAASAIATYRTVLDAAPGDADARFKLAMELWGTSASDEAIAEMKRVTELDPIRADAHERLAIWSYYTGDYASAWTHVHQTRALGGDVPPQFIPLLSGRMADPGPGVG